MSDAGKRLMDAIANAVLSDLTDRSGIGNAFDAIDEDVMEEIREAIGREAIRAILDASGLNDPDLLSGAIYSIEDGPPLRVQQVADLLRAMSEAVTED